MNGATTTNEVLAPGESVASRLPASRYLPKESYDWQLADRSAKLSQLFLNRRFWHVIRSVCVFFITSFFHGRFNSSLTKDERSRYKARAVKELLVKLGPTYIKLGQFLSVRRDLLPVVLSDELASLQDRVPPFDIELVRQIVKEELGSSPEELFAHFDPQSLASASIGQVHRVQLKDGRQAVIKVQRRGLAQDFYLDLGLMRLAAQAGLAFNEYSARLGTYIWRGKPVRPARFDFRNWLEMSDEFGRSLFSEIDYLLEGRNADRLRRLLRDRPEVRIPRVIWKYSGHRVLALEYIEGIKIDRVDELKSRGFDLEQLGNLLVSCYLEQIVIKGFFHADPHAGNLAVDQNGNLVIYDFGMTGEISESQRQRLLACVLAVVSRDVETLVKGLADLGVVRKDSNLEAVQRALTPFMDYYAGRSIFDLDFRQLERDIDTVVTERSLKLPANLAYILRTGSSLEGIARTLKPEFSFIQAVKPVVRKLIAIEGLENLSSLQGLLAFAGTAVSGLKRVASQNGDILGNAKTDKRLERKAPDTCRRCLKQSRELSAVRKRQHMVAFWGIAYVVVSTGTIFITAFLPSIQGYLLGLVVGNIVLAGIMIWNFVKFLTWKPKSIVSDRARNYGEKKC